VANRLQWGPAVIAGVLGSELTDSADELWEERFERLFPGLIPEIQEHQLDFDNCRNQQALANMVILGGSEALRAELEVSDICALISSVASCWKELSKDIGSRVFYARYDEQARQLRMSIIKGKLKCGLPFKAPLKLTAYPGPIASQYLRGSDHVVWDELWNVTWGQTAESG
jgi:hypothetical protein